MKKTTICSLTAAALLSGCATTPKVVPPDTITKSQVRSANYGAYPSNYQSSIRQHLHKSLLDYDSAKIDFYMKPVKIFYLDTMYYTGYKDFSKVFRASHSGTNNGRDWKGFPLYVACVNVNAKNTYGGYTGWQSYEYYFQGDQWYTEGTTYGHVCNAAAKSSDIYVLDLSSLVDVVP